MISMAFWQASLLQKREQLRLLHLEARRSELSLGPWFLFMFSQFLSHVEPKNEKWSPANTYGSCYVTNDKHCGALYIMWVSPSVTCIPGCSWTLGGLIWHWFFLGGYFFFTWKKQPQRKIRVFEVQVSGNRQPSLIELYRIHEPPGGRAHLLVTFLTWSKIVGCSIRKLLWQGLRFKSWKLCWVVMMAWWGTSGWIFRELLHCLWMIELWRKCVLVTAKTWMCLRMRFYCNVFP